MHLQSEFMTNYTQLDECNNSHFNTNCSNLVVLLAAGITHLLMIRRVAADFDYNNSNNENNAAIDS